MNTIEVEIIEALLSEHHGLWFDFVDTTSAVPGSNKKPKARLRGSPYISESFLRLYEYDGQESIQGLFKKLVVPAYQDRVREAILHARNNKGQPTACTIRFRTRSGKEKLIEVYAQRITLSDGRDVLVSLHRDIEAISPWNQLHRVVLDELPGFVFVKEWCPDKKKFVFRFINQSLASAFGLEYPVLAEGHADDDFIDSSEQREAFEDGDRLTAESLDLNFRHVSEEWFTPKNRDGAHIKASTRRLVTVKMPYESYDLKGDRKRMILGIAMDVTAVTDLLRAVLQRGTQNAIYIKDKQHRYQIVNAAFVSLLGKKSENEIIGKTFCDILLPDGKAVLPIENCELLQSLCDEVNQEDSEVLQGIEKSRIRRALFHDSRDWITTKIPVFAGPGKGAPHILGVAQELFGDMSAQLLQFTPQCICVKNEKLEIAWCNRSYSLRHQDGVQQTRQIIGQTDSDLWPPNRFPGQAERYNKKDKLALEIGREVGACAEWKTVLSMLKDNELWEFREEQLDHSDKNTVLQTSKWPLWINNSLYVVVIFSDVTKGDAEQQRIHNDTVHTIRGAAQPLDTSLTLLRELINAPGSIDTARLQKVEQLMAYTKADLDWFLAHHLDLTRSHVDRRPMSLLSLYGIAEQALKYIEAVSQREVFVSLKRTADSGLMILGDEARLTAVLRELTRNAYEAVRARTSVHKLHHKGELSSKDIQDAGWTLLNLSTAGAIFIEMLVVENRLRIEIKDNGEAAYNPKQRGHLHEKLSIFLADPSKETFRLGLAFCLRTAHSHDGTLSYEHFEDNFPLTVMKFEVPLEDQNVNL